MPQSLVRPLRFELLTNFEMLECSTLIVKNALAPYIKVRHTATMLAQRGNLRLDDLQFETQIYADSRRFLIL